MTMKTLQMQLQTFVSLDSTVVCPYNATPKFVAANMIKFCHYIMETNKAWYFHESSAKQADDSHEISSLISQENNRVCHLLSLWLDNLGDVMG